MKTSCIYCFSGTGNTLLATKRLVAALNQRGVETTWQALTPATQVAPGTSGLGIAFPVANQSTYPFVWDFMGSLPPGDGRAVFVATGECWTKLMNVDWPRHTYHEKHLWLDQGPIPTARLRSQICCETVSRKVLNSGEHQDVIWQTG